MRVSRGLVIAAGLILLSVTGVTGAAAFGDLDRKHGRTLGCYKKQVDEAEYGYVARQVMVRPAWTEVQTTPPVYEDRSEKVLLQPARTVWVPARPVYRTVEKNVVVRPASVAWVRKRRHLLDREEVVCKVEVPAVVRTVSTRVHVNAGERVKQHIPAVYGWKHRPVLVRKGHSTRVKHPAVYRTVRERILVRPGHVRWVRIRNGC
ncbi:MAG: hypothetical protein R3D57_17625 [Hyphomicrobiaceae bacterium]